MAETIAGISRLLIQARPSSLERENEQPYHRKVATGAALDAAQ